MLPSVDSRLACRVILLLISTARPVSVLLWIVLRSFLPPASARRITQAKKEEYRKRNSDIVSLLHCITLWLIKQAAFTWIITDIPVLFIGSRKQNTKTTLWMKIVSISRHEQSSFWDGSRQFHCHNQTRSLHRALRIRLFVYLLNRTKCTTLSSVLQIVYGGVLLKL